MHRYTVYGHAEWNRHKSSWRHGRHLSSVVSSGVIFTLGPPVITFTMMAVVVSVINHYVEERVLPKWIPLLHVASLPFTLTAPVLALLLVFRTNASYSRFDEARKAWGSNVNRTRDLGRQALTWIRLKNDAPKLHCLLRHIKAFSFCLKDHLIEDETELRGEIADILDSTELENIMSAKHRPNYVLQVMSEAIAQCQISEWEQITMDANVTTFHDNVGACERIFKTPIPLAYTRLTSRMLTIWHVALPFGLWNTCGWLTIPVSFMSAVALFYIEEVGVFIEEPFWILPLSSISQGICSAVDGLYVAHEEASMLWKTQQQPAPANKKADHVIISFEGSRAEGLRKQQDVDVVLTRVNSVS